MAPLPDLIISSIKEILDNTENREDKIKRHNNVQNSLLELFKGLEYNAIKEFPIKYDRKYRIKAHFGELNIRKSGYIDFYAECKDYKVVVEYDNCASLKWKSIDFFLGIHRLGVFEKLNLKNLIKEQKIDKK